MRRDAISLKLYARWMDALSYANFCADEFAGAGDCFECLVSAAYACNDARRAFEHYCGLAF